MTNRRQISLCRKRWTGYAFALATPSLAIWLRLAFGYRSGDTPLLVVLLIPIMLSVYAGGFWPGIVATAVAGLEASYYLLPPIHSFATDGAYTVDLLALIFVGVFSTFWVEALKRNLETLKVATTDAIRADITARKHAQEAAARLADIVTCSDDAIVGKSLKGIITSWNPGAERIFGYSAREAIGHPIQMLIPATRCGEEAEILSSIIHGESVDHFETMRVRKDGVEIHISATISPVRDAAGQIVGASKIARDITDRRRTETALNEKEAQLHAADSRLAEIVQGMNEACFALDSEYRFTFVNGRGETLLRHTREEMIGKAIWEVFAPAVRALAEVHYRRAMSQRVPVSFEVFSPVALRWLDIRLFPSGDGLAAFILDIHERKLAEEALRASQTTLQESEERFRTMSNSMSQLAWIAQADGFICWYNQRWFEYTGTTREQMEGWGWQSVHDPNVLPRVMVEWTGAIASGKSFEMEFPLRGADGLFRRFLTRAVPLKDAAGQVLQWFGTNTDVDELKRAEDEIRKLNEELEHRVIERTAQLEVANKELEAFSYSVSHDLRAPLRGVHGYVRMLMEDYADRLDANGNRLLGVVGSEAKRMGQLIDDLLAFSRIGRETMGKMPIDLASMAREEFENLNRAAPESTPRFDLQPLLPACGDPAMLRRVFANLLGNAIKFSRHQTHPIVEVGSRNVDGETTFYVKDNGVGFDEQYRHKLFGVFQRLHSEAEFEGTGVGLALVQRVIHRHGGKVWAESKPNEGATFFFTLPTQKAA